MNHAERMPILADIDVSALAREEQHASRPIITRPPKASGKKVEARGYQPAHGATMADLIGVNEALHIVSEAKKLARAVDTVLSRRGAYQEVAIERLRTTYDECWRIRKAAKRG